VRRLDLRGDLFDRVKHEVRAIAACPFDGRVERRVPMARPRDAGRILRADTDTRFACDERRSRAAVRRRFVED
jgi:aminoglycoside phosphotransferase